MRNLDFGSYAQETETAQILERTENLLTLNHPCTGTTVTL